MMKRLLFIAIFLCPSCLVTEIINAPIEMELDTNVYKAPPRPSRPPRDTTQRDTTRIPIGFDVSIEDWDESEYDVGI